MPKSICEECKKNIKGTEDKVTITKYKGVPGIKSYIEVREIKMRIHYHDKCIPDLK